MAKTRFLMIMVIVSIVTIFTSCEKKTEKDATQGTASAAKKDGPSVGYDKVVWGSTLEDVRSAYNIGDEIVAITAEDDQNILSLEQKNVSDSISERTFLFNGNKLYRVWVYYKDGSTNTHTTLVNVLTERYGNPTNYFVEEDGRASPAVALMGGAQRKSTTHTIFERFAPDIEVELLQEITNRSFMNGLSQTSESVIAVCYTWKKFRDEYQASKLEL
ncbi:hypothetical protein AGMMS4952_08800 [Spirochaetia bacterium]|nr:hypothetical protein AGMMS4952_08800 [Spirochaetia bacterium]